MKTWRKSLRKALRKWFDRNHARWPDHYRRLTTPEITETTNLYAEFLTGPVLSVGVSGPGHRVKLPSDWPGHYSQHRLGGCVEIYCLH